MLREPVFDIKDIGQWADLVVATLDRDAPRDELSMLCARYFKPLINVSNAIYLDTESRAINSAYASVQWQFPGDPAYPCLRCHGGLDFEQIAADRMSDRLKHMRRSAGYVVGTNFSPRAQVVTVNSIAAGIASWQITMWAAGLQRPPPWVHFDVMNHRYHILSPTQNDDCSLCSQHPSSCFAIGNIEPQMPGAMHAISVASHAGVQVKRPRGLFNRLRSALKFRRQRAVPRQALTAAGVFGIADSVR